MNVVQLLTPNLSLGGITSSYTESEMQAAVKALLLNYGIGFSLAKDFNFVADDIVFELPVRMDDVFAGSTNFTKTIVSDPSASESVENLDIPRPSKGDIVVLLPPVDKVNAVKKYLSKYFIKHYGGHIKAVDDANVTLYEYDFSLIFGQINVGAKDTYEPLTELEDWQKVFLSLEAVTEAQERYNPEYKI